MNNLGSTKKKLLRKKQKTKNKNKKKHKYIALKNIC